jgi:hypothetical protein
LRHLILTLNSDASTPLEIRDECDMLMLAINANDLAAIADRLPRLKASRGWERFQIATPKTWTGAAARLSDPRSGWFSTRFHFHGLSHV